MGIGGVGAIEVTGARIRGGGVMLMFRRVWCGCVRYGEGMERGVNGLFNDTWMDMGCKWNCGYRMSLSVNISVSCQEDNK